MVINFSFSVRRCDEARFLAESERLTFPATLIALYLTLIFMDGFWNVTKQLMVYDCCEALTES